MTNQGTKVFFILCLARLNSKTPPPDSFGGVVFDGAAIVNYLPPRRSHTFKEYGEDEFLGYVTSQASLMKAERMDVVWDQYFENSTKAWAREVRGAGIRRQVLPRVKQPLLRLKIK